MKNIWVMMLCLLLLTACGEQRHAIIEWVDFIKWNNAKYQGISTGTLADTSLIGEEVGKIKFRINDNIYDPEYKAKNGDAAFLEAGTVLHQVKGHPELLAVKDTKKVNGYYIYYKDKSLENYKWHYKDMPKQEVKKITVHARDNANIQLIREITDPSEIERMFRLLEEGHVQEVAISEEAKEYEVSFYTNEPVAYTYSVFQSQDQYYWMPWEQEVLPAEIGEFLQ
ncbi:hypothetical protein [Ectobacillus antri]|jgi:hypothetical protein|uniref:hypothetical protein n=1 Tax=Ectobacillus antri TaxID=2486280 RepID=UPI000F599FC2|nr:hypothetical protein [Ectobacillus antri]